LKFRSVYARPRTAKKTNETLRNFKWEFLEHPLYSPDLAPSDFRLFGPLKHHLSARYPEGTHRPSSRRRRSRGNPIGLEVTWSPTKELSWWFARLQKRVAARYPEGSCHHACLQIAPREGHPTFLNGVEDTLRILGTEDIHRGHS
jgi:hypothetical protein